MLVQPLTLTLYREINMRLTLRTLLAYRDGVLSASDREDLHRRIQSSPDVGNLLRRLGAVTKLNQVLAPPLLGKGLGGDPNSIAEYLDDSLQHSQIPELERVCLVSDAQLAELADCHTLLSTAMNTKVSVPADLRRMALAVVDPSAKEQVVKELEARRAPRRKRRDSEPIVRPDAAHVPVVVAAPMLASGGESIKPQGLNLETTALTHEVPEYLMGTPSSNWRIPVAIGGLTAVLAVLVWQALGPWDKVAELFATVPDVGDRSVAAPIDFDLITESEQGPPGIAAASGKGQPNAAVTEAAIESDSSAPPGLPSASDSIPIDVDADSQGPPGLDVTVDDQAPPMSAPTGSSNDASVTSEAPPGMLPDGQAPPAAGDGPPRPPAPSETSPAAMSGAALWLPKDQRAAEAVLLTRVGDTLRRVSAGDPLQVPVEMIVPPTTRTTIDLPGGVLWTACGPSQLQLDHWKAGQADANAGSSGSIQPLVTTALCRGLVRSGPDGRQVVVATPVGKYRIELSDASSLAAVEVGYRQEALGSILDPQVTQPVLIIIAAEGTAQVTPLEPAGPSQQLKLGDGVGVVGSAKPQKFRLQNIPTWFRSSVERPIDGLAAEDLHRLLATPADQAIGIEPQLLELSRTRRPETAALATQLALLSGNWQPLVSDFLSNDRLRSHWTPTLNLTRQLLASDAQRAEQLHQRLVDTQGPIGQTLFELICGSPADSLGSEGLAKLVGQLESPQLDVRVVAAYQLQLLTGKSLGFQPASPNRTSVQQWRRDLATNRVELLPPDDPLWESIPR